MTQAKAQELVKRCLLVKQELEAIQIELFMDDHSGNRFYYHAETSAELAAHCTFEIANNLGVVFHISPHDGELRIADKDFKEVGED